MKTWDGLNAEEIASIPRDEYCFQKIERILRERNEVKELSDDEIEALGREHIDIEWFDEGEYGMEYNMYGLVDFARAILKKASEK